MNDSTAYLFKPFNEIEWMIGECFEIIKREKEKRHEAENANRRKDEFLTAVAHELRNTLHSIGGWLNILSSGKLDESENSRAIEAIKRVFKLQTKLVEDLLDASRINSGTFRLNLCETEIGSVIKNVVNDFEIPTKAKQIKLELISSANLGTITADAERLTQVMSNLLTNAIKFTPAKGQISIKTKRTNSFIEMQVIDDGQGINAEFLPFIFDSFSQNEPSGNGQQKGLGLGLSIVRQIVTLHGGSINANSAGLGQGATFTVQIPHNLPTEAKSKNPF